MSQMLDPVTQNHVRQAAAALADEFAGIFSHETIERYIADQTRHHTMADPRVQRRFESLSIGGSRELLDTPRVSGHAQFCYNLHLVLVSRDRDIEIRRRALEARQHMLVAAAAKKGHLIGKGQILADHLHVALGCQLSEPPQEVALGYLNNLAYAAGMKPIFQYGYYVGTFSRYDLDAIRLKLRQP